jgi:L-fuconolactonase
MPDFPLIDTHVHLIDPGRFPYAWMSGRPSMRRPYLPADLTAAAGPVTIEGYVFVEVFVDPPHGRDEGLWVAELAKTDPRLLGIIPAIPFERGREVTPDLDRLAATGLLVGARRLIEIESDPDFCLQPGFLEGMQLLAERNLPFDICCFSPQLPAVTKLVQRSSGRFVLNHLGKPRVRNGEVEPWRQNIRKLAALPNVACKISGLATEADHRNWRREELFPYIRDVIDAFGLTRVMFGGDWPVSELAITYPDWVSIVDEVLAGCSEAERRAVFHDNAVSTYSLKPRAKS